MALFKKKKAGVSMEEAVYMETQAQLIWRKFKKHKLAMAGMIILIILYAVGFFLSLIHI